MICYVDLGIEEEIRKEDMTLKSLLNYFAQLELMMVVCRLYEIEFRLENHQMPLETWNELKWQCRGGPFYLQAFGQAEEILDVKIVDRDDQCLNDLLVKKGLAVRFLSPNVTN